MILTIAQAAQYAIQAGFRGASIATIVAICMAESGLNTQAVSPTQDYGLVQIHLAAHPGVTMACALDPTCSLGKAYAISGGGSDFTPWATYNNGAYRMYLSQAQQAAASASSASAVTPTPPLVPSPRGAVTFAAVALLFGGALLAFD